MEHKLWIAARDGEDEEVAEHLEGIGSTRRQVNVNWRHEESGGQTALHTGCRNDRVVIVSQLLRQPGIDVNQKTDEGSTGFYLACHNGNSDCVRLLLGDPRVLPNEPNDEGATPLRYAAWNGHLQTIRWMVASGRELDLGGGGGGGSAGGSAGGQEEESGIDVIKKARNSWNHTTKVDVVDLLQKYRGDPVATRDDVRVALGVKPTDLERFFGIVLSSCASYSSSNVPAAAAAAAGAVVAPPGEKEDVVVAVVAPPREDDVVSLCLADCGLTLLPEKVAHLTSLTDLDLSFNRLTSLPPWSSSPAAVGLVLRKVTRLGLAGVETLVDFAALSAWLNTAAVRELDLSHCRTLLRAPEQVATFMKNTKRVRKLRLYGSPATFASPFDSDETKALKAANRARNSKFSLAIIQTLLDEDVNNFQAIE